MRAGRGGRAAEHVRRGGDDMEMLRAQQEGGREEQLLWGCGDGDEVNRSSYTTTLLCTGALPLPACPLWQC